MTEKGSSKLIGCRVRIKTKELYEYEGTVKSVYGELSKILIYKVVEIPSNKPVVGPMTFCGREILSCQIVEPKHTIQSTNMESQRKVILPKLPFGELASGGDNSVNEMKQIQRNFGKLWLCMGSEELSNGFDLDLDKPNIRYRLPDKYVIIDRINEVFNNAIEQIKSYPAIGVHIEGAGMGRLGKICFLNIATTNCIFLFDVLELGKEAFAAGLKDILENKSINKVFHNCRLASDILFNQYSVTLKNVSDTQVIDIMQRRYYHKLQLPEYVRSMSVLLKQFLELEEECISFNLSGLNRIMDDVMSWEVRPLPLNQRIYAIRNVIYLHALYNVLMDKFLNDIKRGTEIYLELVRDNEDVTLAVQLANSITLPSKIGEMFGQSMKFYRNFHPKEHQDAYCIWDRERLLEGTDATPDQIVEFCMAGIKASDFKSPDIEQELFQSSNSAFALGPTDSETHERSGSDKKSFESNLMNKGPNIIPSGMEGRVTNKYY